MKRIYRWGLLLFFTAGLFAQKDSLIVTDGIEGRIGFWEKIFTEYSINQIVIHDASQPERIYRVLDFRQLDSRGLLHENMKRDSVEAVKYEILTILKKLAVEHDTSLFNASEKTIYSLFGKNTHSNVFRKAQSAIRAQKGARETFQAGLIRSGRYIAAMQAIFKEKGLPEDLVYLAHVESAFHPKARSPVGALGVWQFMSSTGREYLNINTLMDERRDPILSTRGAANLLKSNYQKTGSWPLAVTAYNHGTNGIRRAINSVGTRDLSKIIDTYQSPLFGYASKNFYAEFVAACRIAKNPEAYFPNIQVEEPVLFKLVQLPFAFSIREAAEMFNVKPALLAEMNPALNQVITRQGKKIPRGYMLRLPVESKALGVLLIHSGMGAAVSGF